MIFGQGSFQIDPNLSPEELARRREILANARPAYGRASTVGEGLAHLGSGIFSGLTSRKLNKIEREQRSAATDIFNQVLSGGQKSAPVKGPLMINGIPPTGNDIQEQKIIPNPHGLPQEIVDAVNKPDDPAAVIRAGLIERGLPEHVADGFVMNFRDESGLNPGINEIAPVVPGSRGGFGLAQWTGPRRVALEEFAQSSGRDVSDVDTQLDFLMHELQGSEAAAARSIFGAPDAPSAAQAVLSDFLRPAAEHQATRSAKYGGGQPNQLTELQEAMANPWLTQGQRATLQQMISAQTPQTMSPYQQAQLDLKREEMALRQAGKWTPGTSVTVNNGAEVPLWGDAPKDHVWLKDSQGEVITEPDPSGRGVRPVAVPIAGGPDDTAQEDAQAQENKERSGGVVTEDIGRALSIVRNNPTWTTGLGATLSSVPGTEAKTLASLIQTIKANVGFDRLQQMRDASKTGGALGAINQTEMSLLTSALGSLDQSLNAEELAKNLERINDIYMDIIHGPGNWGSPSHPEEVSGKTRLKWNPETGEFE